MGHLGSASRRLKQDEALLQKQEQVQKEVQHKVEEETTRLRELQRRIHQVSTKELDASLHIGGDNCLAAFSLCLVHSVRRSRRRKKRSTVLAMNCSQSSAELRSCWRRCVCAFRENKNMLLLCTTLTVVNVYLMVVRTGGFHEAA